MKSELNQVKPTTDELFNRTLDILQLHAWDLSGGISENDNNITNEKYHAQFIPCMPKRLRSFIDEDKQFYPDSDLCSAFTSGFDFDGTDNGFAESIRIKIEEIQEHDYLYYGNILVDGMSDLKADKLASDIELMVDDMSDVAKTIEMGRA